MVQYVLKRTFYAGHIAFDLPQDAGAREGAIIEMEYGEEIHVGVCINDREFIHMTRLGCRINQIGIFKIRGIYGIDTRI